MINVTGGKDGEKVSVELIGSKDEVVREAGYVIEAVAEKIFVKNNGRGFDQATKRERIECICAAYNGMFLSFALDNNLSAFARELVRIGVIGSVDFEKLAGDSMIHSTALPVSNTSCFSNSVCVSFIRPPAFHRCQESRF